MADKFVLKHGQIEIDYTPGITPGIPALIYKDGSVVKEFKTFPNEITTDKTAFGLLVSVVVQDAIEGRGGEHFAFFLPEDVIHSSEKTEKFTTMGIYLRDNRRWDPSTRAPKQVSTERVRSWKSIELHGTAQEVAVPQVEPKTE